MPSLRLRWPRSPLLRERFRSSAMRNKVRAWLHRNAVTQAIHGVAWILALAALSLGFAAIVGAPTLVYETTFAVALAVAPPQAWGAVWAGLGGWLAVRLALEPPAKPAARPLYLLAAVTASWGLMAVGAVAFTGGASTAMVVYVALASIAALCGYAIEKGSG